MGNRNLVIKNVNNAKKVDLIDSITQKDIDKFEAQNVLEYKNYNHYLKRFNQQSNNMKVNISDFN